MTNRRIRPYIPIILIYFGFVFLRFILSCLTTSMPSVRIDEFLYSSLGKSIATEGRLLFRGQPALYNYFIYPLFLAPVYLIFPQGADFYRIIQCWNAILMNLALFPAYALCRKTLKDNKRALWVSAAFLLLPDFSLSEFIFSEAIIYPMFFGLVYLIYLSIGDKKTARFAGMGILGAFLYFTKPGAVVLAVVSLLFFLVHGLIRKDRKETACAVCGIISFLAVFGILYATVRFAFGYTGTLLSVYDEQLNTEGLMFWDVFLKAAARYPYYFCLACGIVPAVAAILNIRKCGQNVKIYYRLLTVSLVILMIGTAWTINRTEHSDVLFLRYMAMFIPLVFLGCLIPAKDPDGLPEEKEKLSISAILLCVYLVVCTAVWGSTTGAAGYYNNHFMVSLSILVQPKIQGTANILVYLITGFSLYLTARHYNKRILTVICCAFYLIPMLINNAGGYAATGSNALQAYRTEALNVQRNIIQGEEYLYLFSSEKYSSDHGLNMYSKHNVQQLEWYDFFNTIHEHDGVYVPFVPVSERGMNESAETPDVTMLVAERTTYPLIKFSENIRGEYSEEGSFYIGRFEKGARIVDAMIANMENFKLLKTDYGVLTLYRDDWINHPIKVTLTIESPVLQNMRFFANDEHSITIPLQEGKNFYEIRIPNAAKGYNFVVDRDDIMVYGFDIESQE